MTPPPLTAPLLFFENPTLLDPTPSPSLPWSTVSTRDLRVIIDGLHSWAHQPLDSLWFLVNKAEGIYRVAESRAQRYQISVVP